MLHVRTPYAEESRMKAYESVIWHVKDFFTTDFGILVLVIAGMVTFATVASYETSTKKQERLDNVAWCLDQGGRRVNVDGINDCFQLTEVLLESETFEEQERECTRVPTQTYIKAPGHPTLHFCYEFKRVNREN